jgi:hypothetical protein
MSYWNYPIRSLRDLWLVIRCIWITSWVRRYLRYFTKRERALRWHLERARQLNAYVYCVYHACDMKDCEAEHSDE